MPNKAWLVYLLERLFPQLSLLVILGIALSCVTLEKGVFQLFPFLTSFVILVYMAFYLRLADDLEDFEQDQIAFPDRALVKQTISKQEAEAVQKKLQIGMIFVFAWIFIFFNGATRLALLLTSGYFWLFLNDFYSKKWAKRHPFIQGFAKHGIAFFLALLVVSMGRPSLTFSTPGIAYALIVFSSLIVYDICRKLDPYSHPVSLAYIHYYGFRITNVIAKIFLVISAICAYFLNLQLWLWPFEILVAFTLSMLFKHPKRFQITQIASFLSLLAHSWAGVFQYL